MQSMKLDDIRPSMVLACDLNAPNGRLLLSAGTELTESHLAMLRRVGIVRLKVRASVSQEDLELVAKYVRNFFMFVNHDDPVMNKLFELATLRTSDAMALGWKLPEDDPRPAKDTEHFSDLFLRDQGTPQDMVNHEQEIVSFPDVYFRLKEIVGKDDVSAKDVAAVVNTDAGLSARLLKLVNSPFYGFSAGIDSVGRAVALVGEKELSTLAIGISAISYFKDIPPELVDMKVFWKHSLSCAVLCAIFAAKIGNMATEQLFTAGLLHDVGRLIMFKKLPYASVQSLIFAKENSLPLVEAEKQVFGYDHTEVASLLMSTWKFPKALRTLVTHHHNPPSAGKWERAAAVVQLADCMTNALEISEGGRFVVPPLATGALDCLGLCPQDLTEAVIEFDRQFADMAGAFL